MIASEPREPGSFCIECDHPECRAVDVYADAFRSGAASALANEAGYTPAAAEARGKDVIVSALADPATRFEIIRRVETIMGGADPNELVSGEPLSVTLDEPEGVHVLAHAEGCNCDADEDVEVTIDGGVDPADALQVMANEVASAYEALIRVARITAAPGRLPVLLKRDLTDALGDYARLGER